MKYALMPLAIFVAAMTGVARGEAPPETAPATQPAPTRLVLVPRAFPEPAMKYALMPPVIDQVPGDAAPLYFMAFRSLPAREEADKIEDLLEAPSEKFSADAAQALLARFEPTIALLGVAGRRDRCHWEVPFREEGFSALLPQLNSARGAARLLALSARVEIVQGRFGDALRTLQSEFGLVQHFNSDGLLVQGLVAQWISQRLLDQVEQFIQAPGAPNLYWALAAMPRPISDIRAMTWIERSFLEFELPELKTGRPPQLQPGRLSAFIERVETLTIGPVNSPNREHPDQTFDALVAASEGPARLWLQVHGRTTKQVHDMTAEQAVGAYFIETYREKSDELYKWAAFPYWQAHDGYRAAADELSRAMGEKNANPLLRMAPALFKVHRSIARTDRRIVMLQTAEALRGYAAAHDGKLPASLTDLEETPAPLDPMTGKMFEYQAIGNTARLHSSAPADFPSEEGGTLEITLRRGR